MDDFRFLEQGADNRFRDLGVDAEFPAPGQDLRFAVAGQDARFQGGYPGAAQITLEVQGDGTPVWDSDSQVITVDVTGWAEYETYDGGPYSTGPGTFQFTQAQLTSAPGRALALVPPVASPAGPYSVGNVVTMTRPLWIFDASEGGSPIVSDEFVRIDTSTVVETDT
ncbi:MAG: hypothetical protein AAGF55_00970, partial [Pseudomonadota bacterium]